MTSVGDGWDIVWPMAEASAGVFWPIALPGPDNEAWLNGGNHI